VATKAQQIERRVQHIRRHLESYPHLQAKILRQLLIELHTAGKVSVDKIYREAKEDVQRNDFHQSDHNVGEATRLPSEQRQRMNELIIRYAAQHFTRKQIDKIVHLAVRREFAQALEDFANLPNVSFDLLAEKLREFLQLPEAEKPLPASEAMGIRAALIRHFISDQLEFIGIAKHHLRIHDFLPIVNRSIGPRHGIGKIGGKAAGMLLAYRILTESPEVNKPGCLPLAIPDSYYLRSDLYQQFVQENGLMIFYDQKYKPLEEVRKEYPVIKEIFKNSEFPPEIVDKFRELLEEVGNHPLIVRSSSLLEDNFGSAFSGKYDSIFLPNQGPLEQRLQALIGAVAEVYASTLGPDPISYRREKNLIDYDERMGVLIQKVVGIRFRHYFLPIFAGVAFSRNVYRWSPRIRREDGLVRIVMGLGTRAVDRVAADYPRMIALGVPHLRPEIEAKNITRYSQRWIDVINLAANRFESITLPELLGDMSEPFPELYQIVSIRKEGHLQVPVTKLIDADPRDMTITFDRLATQTDFPERMRLILKRLEKEYKSPVDVEFAYDGKALYILQCRPQASRIQMERVHLPKNVPSKDILFTAQHDVPNALVKNIEYIVYVDPKLYDELESMDERLEIARVVGTVNDRLEGKKFVLIGPGRWGSNDLRLGVRVRYSDINHARVLVEVAYQKNGFTPEVSFGTHFFQDLVEAGIVYLPVFPNEEGVIYHEEFFRQTENSLAEIAPEHARWQDIVRVIHVPSVTGGRKAVLASDGEDERALFYVSQS